MKIDIYTGPMCPYCTKAKELLEQKNLSFNELYIGDDFKIMEEMLDRSGGKRTVPQIFMNVFLVGGYDERYAIDRSGELDKLLES